MVKESVTVGGGGIVSEKDGEEDGVPRVALAEGLSLNESEDEVENVAEGVGGRDALEE